MIDRSASNALGYVRLAERDRATLILLRDAARRSGADVSGWIITLHFYVLCVLVKAVGRTVGEDFQDHFRIRQWINTHDPMSPLAASYRNVEEWSRDARSEGRRFNAAEFARFRAWFEHVRDGVGDILTRAGVSPPSGLVPVEP